MLTLFWENKQKALCSAVFHLWHDFSCGSSQDVKLSSMCTQELLFWMTAKLWRLVYACDQYQRLEEVWPGLCTVSPSSCSIPASVRTKEHLAASLWSLASAGPGVFSEGQSAHLWSKKPQSNKTTPTLTTCCDKILFLWDTQLGTVMSCFCLYPAGQGMWLFHSTGHFYSVLVP